jgi:hypothetical protein
MYAREPSKHLVKQRLWALLDPTNNEQFKKLEELKNRLARA